LIQSLVNQLVAKTMSKMYTMRPKLINKIN